MNRITFTALITLSIFTITISNVPIGQSKVPKLIVIGQYRSGSTFTGELMSSFPGSFYSFEPFHFYTTNQVPNNQTGIDLLNGFINCNFVQLIRGHKWPYTSLYWSLQKHIVPVVGKWTVRKMRNHDAKVEKNYDPDDNDVQIKKAIKPGLKMEQVCRQSNGIIVKSIRIRMELMETYFERVNDSSVHILFLVRDPRGTINSRMSFKEPCRYRKDCINPVKTCHELVDDYLILKRLKMTYPNNFHVIKFEDLINDPVTMSRDLYHRIGFKITDQLDEFIKNHTTVSKKTKNLAKGHPYSTVRDSKLIGDKWKTHLDEGTVRKIEQDCSVFFDLFNYEKIY